MANKDSSDINLEIRSEVLELKHCIEAMDQDIQKLGTQGLKAHQEDVRKRLNELMMQFCQSDDQGNLQVFWKTEQELQALKEELDGLKKAEDDVKRKLNQLVEFGESDDLGGSAQGQDVSVTGTAGFKKDKEDAKTELIDLKTEFEHTDVDSEGQEEEMPELLSDGTETEVESEEFERKEGDVRKRFIEKIMVDSSSSDDLDQEVSAKVEGENSNDDDLDVYTNIEGLKEEMQALMGESGRKGKEKSEDSSRGIERAKKDQRVKKSLSHPGQPSNVEEN